MKKAILNILLLCGSLATMEIQGLANTPSHINLNQAVKVKYRNWRGEVAIRLIIPLGEIYWGSTEYHPHDQWLLKVWDIEKQAERIYAFKDILEFDVQ